MGRGVLNKDSIFGTSPLVDSDPWPEAKDGSMLALLVMSHSPAAFTRSSFYRFVQMSSLGGKLPELDGILQELEDGS